MNKYSQERKDQILKLLFPPHNLTPTEAAKQEGISVKNIYNWRKALEQQGKPMPGQSKNKSKLSSEAKLAIIAQIINLSEHELSEYCRKNNLYVEQVNKWKANFISGFEEEKFDVKQIKQQAREDKAEIKSLKRELKYKEKALVETAALLVLRKKLNALYGEEHEES